MLVLFYICNCNLQAQSFSFDSVFNKKDILKKVSADAEKYKLQIIYTRIKRDKEGKPSFTNYTYKLDSNNYFYCASLVKLPCSVLVLEKLNALGIDKNAIMFTDSATKCQHTVKKDTSSNNGYPSIAHYIKRMLLVSDNVAYGRIYEFLGVDYIHDRLAKLGFKNTRIIHRFDGDCKDDEHTTTNPISFYDETLNVLYTQPLMRAEKKYTYPLCNVKVGKAHIDSKNKKINTPKDFSSMNYISLQTIHAMLQRLVFNEYLPKTQQYAITKYDQQFLLNYLTLYPRESSSPRYNKNYFDSYKKYFIHGDSKKPITNIDIKITNIVGQSYGFMVDCAYIKDSKKNIEFMLSAVIYTNADEVINDGKYEYNSIALPFLAELGRQIYNFEIQEKK